MAFALPVIISAGLSTAAAAFTGTLMLSSVTAYFLISSALGAAMYALSPRPAMAIKGYSIAGANGSAMDQQIIYGRTKVGGARVYDTTTATNNRFLHRILVFAGHEIESYDQIYLNDEIVTLDVNGNVTAPARYVGNVRIKRYFGTTVQTADPDLTSETSALTEATGKWTADHRLQGLAYLYIRFKYDEDAYPNGVPVVSAVIKGKKVFDPRTSLTAWSDNPALCARDYLTNTVYGMSIAGADINDTAFNAAANICDQITESEKRYTCNGSFATAAKPFDIMQSILSSMGGILWYSAGEWKVKAASYTSPVMSFTDNDLRSSISISPRHSRRDNFNTVKGTFAGTSSDWQVTDYPEVTDPVFVAEDGGKVQAMDLALPFTSSEFTAQRIARIALFRNRQQITVRASFSLKALGVEVGDNITITNSRMGWTNKPFEVINWSFGVADDGAVIINTVLRETSSAAFVGVNGQALTLDNTTLPDPFDISAPSNLAATNSTVLNTDGTSVTSIFVTWDAITTGFTGFYDFEWKLSTAATWNSVDVTDTQYQIIPAINGATYNIRVRAVNALGIRGPFATLNATGGADTTAPGVPTTFTANPGPERINLRWINPTAVDFSKVQIRRGTTNVFASSVQIAETTGTEFIDDGLGAVVTRFYWIRALDRTGNASAYAGPVSATTTTRVESGATLPSTGNYEGRLFYNETDGKLYRYHDGAWTAEVPTTDLTGTLGTAQFATTIRPVEVLGALPATGNFQGRTVFLTTDNKLYRHTGSPLDATGFTTATATTDLTGQVSQTQIADGAISVAKFASGIEPIEILSALPATGNFQGRTVFLTTDNKLYRHTGSPLDATGFTTAVPAVDVTGQLTGTQIADGAINTAKFASGIEPIEILSALPATGNFQGRMVFLTTDNKLYRHTGSPLTAAGFTVAVAGADIVANSITAGQIAAGAIGATQIAAGAIIASKIAVSDFTNIIPDSEVSDTGVWPAGSGNEFSLVNPSTSGFFSSGHISRPAGFTTIGERICVATRRFSVKAGQEYWWQYQVLRVGGTTMRSIAQLIWYNAAGTFIASNTLGSFAANTTAGIQTRNGAFIVPANAVSGAWRWNVLGDGTDCEVQFASPELRVRNGGELIVDGAITASKIAATTITGDKIAAGTITASNIATDTITAGQIAAGAISASEIAAGAVTTAKLAVGSINNTIHNSQFYGGLSGWNAGPVSGNTGVMSVRSNTTFTKPGGPVLQVYQPDAGTVGYVDVRTQRIGETGTTSFGWPVQEGTYWEASAYVSAHRCTATIRIEWRNITGTVLGYTNGSSNAADASSSTDPDLWPRLITRGLAPAGAAYATIHLRKLPTSSGADSFMMVYKPLLGETVQNATEAFDWVPGGYTLISGDTILTGSIQAGNIAASTITGDKIAGTTITAANIAADTITAGQIAAGAIGASEVAAGAITATKLAVADFTNTVPDNQLQEVAAWSNGTRYTIVNPTTVSPAPSKGELRYTGAFGIGNQVSDGPRFAVVGGQEYWYNYALARVGGTTYRAWGTLVFFDAAGVATGVALGSTTTDRTNGSPLYIEGSVTAPATAVEALWRWTVNTTVTDSAVRCWIPTIRVKNGGQLIVDGAITAAKIAANTITAAQIAADTITGGQIAAATITASEIAADTITAAQIAAGAITASEMAANSITAANGAIADLTVTTLKIGNNAVTVPVRSIATGDITCPWSGTVWTQVATATIVREGFPTRVELNIRLRSASSSIQTKMMVRLLRAGVVIKTFGGTIREDIDGSYYGFVTEDSNTGTGSTTYTIEIEADSADAIASERFLELLQLKR
ncbi:Fibronectin type III [uncultured Caudovirales phage]|uniref:Fibronectin type III n=1 Tax=uncultured Caudovirales phage TaxID=2100421 RepID=A0A6J5M2Z9_9CAUD|nr:Fibronectin type III [uncultured Caudovirales phage]